MKNSLLLIEDVEDLGRKGEIVTVKPGYSRNFLLPQKKAVIADKHTLRMQERLQAERAKQATVDKEEAEALAGRLNGMQISITVKVDPEGHMYGSVGQMDIVRLFEKEGVPLEKRNVVLSHPLKTVGVHNLSLKLKEGVTAAFVLTVESEIAEQA